jgi:DedD protein
MAERIADDADLAVDELKRRARRRLIGAIVLALAAAVILPLLLEQEPKPLGDDVSVQIPPVDEGRFVNRLTGRASDAKGAAKSDARPLPKAPPPRSEVPPVAPPSEAASAPPTAAESAVATPPATNVPPPRKSVSEAEQKVLAGAGNASVVAKADPAPPVAPPAPPPAAVAPAPAPLPATPPAAAPSGQGFAVQLAAFTDDKGANALAAKLKKAGYASTYTEPVETSRGTLWRVRVGGFATRPDADAARAKLKSDGWNGLVVSAK